VPGLAGLTLPLRYLRAELSARRGFGRDERSGASVSRTAALALASCYGDRLGSSELRSLARRCVIHREWRRVDHRDLVNGAHATRRLRMGPIEALAGSGRGAVVASIHLGPYLFVAGELLRSRLRVVAVADDEVMDRDMRLWAENAHRVPGKLELLPVRGPGSLLRALRALESGAIVLVYVDGGNSVVGPGARTPHQIEIPLGSLPVRFRSGAAYLAQRAQAPSFFAVARRDRRGGRDVEFSDPVPPPARDDAAGAAALMRTGAAWFARRILDHPEQWLGWLIPLMAWASTGDAPTASREQLERTRTRVRGLLADASGRARLSADPVRVGALHEGRDRILVDGPRRRVLAATPLGVDVLRAAQRNVRFAELSRRVSAEPGALEWEVSRMVLAGLATIEDEGRA
jgi:hypothetical protein